jgi:HicB-like protein involved in pilus formation
MNIDPYVESIRTQLETAAQAGDEKARALAQRLAAPLDSAIRLALQDALAAAAEEITLEIAPGSVELRLRGREPEFVVTFPDVPEEDDAAQGDAAWRGQGDDGDVARINLRLPDRLKSRIEEAAEREGLSVNAWLVRAAGAAVDRRSDAHAKTRRGTQRYTGWAR